MRLATIKPAHSGPPSSGMAFILEDGSALTLGALARISGWPAEAMALLSLADLLGSDPGLSAMRTALSAAEPRAIAAAALPAGSFHFGPPIPRPGKVVGVGYNYLGHVKEQGIEKPARPVLFSKFASSVIGDGEAIRHPSGTRALDLEAELAVVIGRRAARVRSEDALNCVAGYTAANDVTARDWQGQAKALGPGEKGDGQWLRAKGSDTFLPLGPVVVTPDGLGDGKGLAVRSWVTAAAGPNAGKPFAMQDGTTADLLFSVAELIAIISAEVTLDPGDVIVTGTPSGVGVFRDPPMFLAPGDLVRVEVERIGSLTSPIADENGNAPTGTPAADFLAELATDGEHI